MHCQRSVALAPCYHVATVLARLQGKLAAVSDPLRAIECRVAVNPSCKLRLNSVCCQ